MILVNETIFFSNNRNELFSIDSRTGILNWKQPVNSSLKPTISENYIFNISEEGYLFVIDTETGNIIRITDVFSTFKKREKLSEYKVNRTKRVEQLTILFGVIISLAK